MLIGFGEILDMTTGASRSSVVLIAGSGLLLMAIVCGVIAFQGQLRLAEVKKSFSNATENLPAAVNVDLTVPGTTVVTLRKGRYDIAMKGDTIGGADFDETTFTLPPMTWEITGPSEVEFAGDFTPVVAGNQARVGTFAIGEDGEYQIVAALLGGESTDYSYNLESDVVSLTEEYVEEIGNEVAGGVVNTGVAGLQILLGSLCGGVFGLIGFVMVVLHFLNGKSRSSDGAKK
ncbi:MAG: hypothetical protein ACI9G1_000160 [Pirellulaceae bacterium]